VSGLKVGGEISYQMAPVANPPSSNDQNLWMIVGEAA
jgi:hypothetical protein